MTDDQQDPSIGVVHAAIGFATAAVHGEFQLGHAVAVDALRADPHGFLDALLTTIQAIADDVDEHGADTGEHLRELGLGLHLAQIAGIADLED